MPEGIEKIKQQILDFWNNLEKNQKTRLMISAGILLIAVVVGLVVATRTEYVKLLTFQDPKQGQEVQKILDEKQIKYKPGSNGEILVDAKQFEDADFAIKTTPGLSETVKFEDSWNLLKLSSTESDKKQLWDNYNKESLIKKIKKFDNIKDADITLSIPEKSNYFSGDENEKASASVSITPKGEITEEQVRGITLVVAAAIEGLSPKDVIVVDNNLNILSNEAESDSIGKTSSQYKLRLRYRKDIEKMVKDLFTGRSDSYDYIKVVANPVVDFDVEKSSKNDVQKPTDLNEAIVSSSTTTEKLKNGSSAGAPGVDSNSTAGAPTYQASETGNASDYNKKTETVNRVFSEVKSEYEKALGKINYNESSMTLAVWYGDRVADDKKITADFINQIKLDVSGATGIPITKISVNKYKLAPQEIIEKSWQEVLKEYVDSFGYLAIMLILVGALIILARPKKKVEEEVLPEEDMVVDEFGNVVGPRFVTPEQGEELPEIDLEERSEVKKQLDKFVKQKPDAVAQLLRNWLQDDWD